MQPDLKVGVKRGRGRPPKVPPAGASPQSPALSEKTSNKAFNLPNLKSATHDSPKKKFLISSASVPQQQLFAPDPAPQPGRQDRDDGQPSSACSASAGFKGPKWKWMHKHSEEQDERERRAQEEQTARERESKAKREREEQERIQSERIKEEEERRKAQEEAEQAARQEAARAAEEKAARDAALKAQEEEQRARREAEKKRAEEEEQRVREVEQRRIQEEEQQRKEQEEQQRLHEEEQRRLQEEQEQHRQKVEQQQREEEEQRVKDEIAAAAASAAAAKKADALKRQAQRPRPVDDFEDSLFTALPSFQPGTAAVASSRQPFSAAAATATAALGDGLRQADKADVELKDRSERDKGGREVGDAGARLEKDKARKAEKDKIRKEKSRHQLQQQPKHASRMELQAYSSITSSTDGNLSPTGAASHAVDRGRPSQKPGQGSTAAEGQTGRHPLEKSGSANVRDGKIRGSDGKVKERDSKTSDGEARDRERESMMSEGKTKERDRVSKGSDSKEPRRGEDVKVKNKDLLCRKGEHKGREKSSCKERPSQKAADPNGDQQSKLGSSSATVPPAPQCSNEVRQQSRFKRQALATSEPGMAASNGRPPKRQHSMEAGPAGSVDKAPGGGHAGRGASGDTRGLTATGDLRTDSEAAAPAGASGRRQNSVVECIVEDPQSGGPGITHMVDLRRQHSFNELWSHLGAVLPMGALPDRLDAKLIYMDGDGDWLLVTPDEHWALFAQNVVKILISSNC